MNKAYDRIEWDFLEAVMVQMRFHRWWIYMVMGCVSTVNFSVLINGQAGNGLSLSRSSIGGSFVPLSFPFGHGCVVKVNSCGCGGWVP
ncbi:hypothetical protein PS2_009283 [Malus domestica]